MAAAEAALPVFNLRLPEAATQPFSMAELFTETPEMNEPLVRGATPEDAPALRDIELKAYYNVYGQEPSPEVRSAVLKKYQERIDLLGDFVRVVETPQDGVYGMIVCCPTKLTSEELEDNTHDMTSNETLQQVYDAEGKYGYVVNLAVRPDKQNAGESGRLFVDAIGLGQEKGIEKTFFTSRLPGFQRWLNNPSRTNENLDNIDSLAGQYWQATRTGRDGTERPIDPLLRAYVGLGAKPLSLVKDAWNVDTPSRGYGVLCEFELPPPPPRVNECAAKHIDMTHASGEVVVPSEVDPNTMGFLSRAWELTKRRKTAIAVGSALVGAAYTTAVGGGSEIVDNVQENAPWVVGAYLGSMAVYAGGAATMLLRAGKSLRKIFQAKSELSSISDELRNSRIMKAGLLANAVGGVAAAGVAGAGIIETLPPSAWGALAIPAIDIFSTITLRRWLYGKMKSK